MRIELQLFGKPSLKMDQTSVEISLKKSEAMLYYIAYEKRVTRDEVVSIIWCDVEQQIAKKNMRNSLYRLKKDINDNREGEIELFRCPNKHVMELDDQSGILVDVDREDAYFLKHYKGKFLENFTLKESDEFERWRQDVENTLNQKYMRLAQEAIRQVIQEGDYKEALQLALVMRRIDDFDESVVRQLMTLYHQLGQFKQITELYTQFKTTLDEEMGIQPDKSTRDLYYSLVYESGESDVTTAAYYGRVQETEHINKMLHMSALGKNKQALILTGEAGVGKTKLIEESLNKYEGTFKKLKMSCYPAETNYAYKAWNDVFTQIATLLEVEKIEIPLMMRQVFSKFFPGFEDWTHFEFTENTESINADYLEKLMLKLFERLLRQTRIILYIDDMQWMDAPSLKLLLSMMLHVDGFVFVGTLRNEYSSNMESFIAQLYKYDRLTMIPIERFSKEETFELMDFLSEEPIEHALKEKIYHESEGNAFFIVEGTMALAQKKDLGQLRYKSILDSRFIGLEPNEMKVLVMISLFFDEVEFNLLKRLLNLDEDEILECIQVLKKRYLLKESDGDDLIKLKFTHHKLREHVYQQIPVSKKRILHNRVGALIEASLVGDGRDALTYQKLIYHYSSAGNTQKHLEFYIRYLKTYFDFSHELYPELTSPVNTLLDKTPDDYFEELEQLFSKLDQETSRKLKIQFIHLKARYDIRQGRYQEGMELVKELIEESRDIHDDEMLFKAYVQWFYYLIQTEQIQDMDDVMNQVAPMTLSAKNEAVYLRLLGIMSLMKKRYEEACVFFSNSIQCFERLGKLGRYVLNIAAAYNYISEAYRRQNKLEEALSYVEKSIELCRLHNIMRGSSIFNTNAGMIAYQMEKYEQAKLYFEEALANYESVDTVWRRSEAEGYLGVILLKQGNEAMGRHYLKMAKQHAEIIGTPETIKLIDDLEKML